MGIKAIRDRLAEIVEAIEPVNDFGGRRFRRAEDDQQGHRPDIIGDPTKGVTRQFVIRPDTNLTRDAGEAGTPAGRLIATMNTQVLYRWNQVHRGIRVDIMQEDCAAIQVAFQKPNDWQRPTSGILSIAPSIGPTFETTSNQDGQDIATVMTIPHEVSYREVTP